MNSYIKWVTTEGEVARVKDSWNNIIWEKPRKLWINNYGYGPVSSDAWTSFADVQISYDRSTWINPTNANQGEWLGTYTNSYFTIYPGRKFYVRFVYTVEDLGMGDPVDSGDDIYSIAMGVMKSSMDSYFETEHKGWNESGISTNLCTIAGITQLISEHQDALIQDYYGKGTGEILFNATNVFEDLVLIISAGSTTSGQVSWNLNDTIYVGSSPNTISFRVTDNASKGWRIDSPEWVIINPSVGSGSLTVNMSAQKNTSIDERSGVLELYDTTTDVISGLVDLHQSGRAKRNPSWNVPATFRFDSNGQSDLSASGLDLNITDPDNVGWTIEGPSYVGNSLVSGDQLPISGTGNKSLSLAPDVNTSSERTFDLVLKASTGAVIATCNCTQDASESENTVAMKIAISNADQVLDVADHNPEVCINTNGLTVTDGLSLGTIVSMDSQYIYIDIPESNIAELYNKLQVDWKYNQFLYVHILNGSTNPDTVYNNETSEHTDFYNNENFLLCEIAKVQADLFTKVENVVTSHGSIILESDCIIEEYQTRYHAVIKTDESWVSKVSSQFSSEKFGLVWLMNRDNNTIYLPIFPYVTGVDAGGSVPKLRMDVYRCIPMPLSVFKLNNLAFVTDFAATESTQVGIVSISEIKTGNLSLSNLPTFVLSETYFGTEVPGFDSSVVLEMQNPSVLDLSNHVSTAFKGDIIITLNCDDLFLDIS